LNRSSPTKRTTRRRTTTVPDPKTRYSKLTL